MMIKTTPAERQSHKSARRIRRLKRLVDRLGLRIALGKESVKHVDAVLKRISEQGYFPLRQERRNDTGNVERPHWIDSITNEEAEVLLKTKDKPKSCRQGQKENQK